MTASHPGSLVVDDTPENLDVLGELLAGAARGIGLLSVALDGHKAARGVLGDQRVLLERLVNERTAELRHALEPVQLKRAECPQVASSIDRRECRR